MEKTSSKIAAMAPAPASAPKVQPEADAAAAGTNELSRPRRRALLAFLCLLHIGLIASMASSVAGPAWRARHDPRELALVAGPIVLLAAIFACVQRAAALGPDLRRHARAERRRLQAAVWALSTAMYGLLACRVAAVVPPALAALVWCVAAVVVLGGFYMLVIHKGQQEYQAVGDCGDGEASNKCRPADDELV